jgi:hypothetical protein
VEARKQHQCERSENTENSGINGLWAHGPLLNASLWSPHGNVDPVFIVLLSFFQGKINIQILYKNHQILKCWKPVLIYVKSVFQKNGGRTGHSHVKK